MPPPGNKVISLVQGALVALVSLVALVALVPPARRHWFRPPARHWFHWLHWFHWFSWLHSSSLGGAGRSTRAGWAAGRTGGGRGVGAGEQAASGQAGQKRAGVASGAQTGWTFGN
jgi:hypothetical protein